MTIKKSRPFWLGSLEYIFPALAVMSLLISCRIISSQKFFWNDELYSYYLLSEHHFHQMLMAFHDKINNTPFLYFLTGWLWAKLFGASEISLRMFSSLGMCVGLILIWITLRRTYPFRAVAIGVLAVFGTSEIILSQNAEARMYGLFLAVCAAAFLLYDLLSSTNKPSRTLLLINGLIHVAIIHTHLFGAFYSAAFLLALFLSDRYKGRFRPGVYLSIALNWTSIIFYIPSFMIQADAGNPRTWLPMPVIKDLFHFLNITSSSFVLLPVLVGMALLSILFLWIFKLSGKPASKQAGTNSFIYPAEVHHLILACLFVLVPVFMWVVSVTIKPVFNDRYMIPTAISWCILITSLFSLISRRVSVLNGHKLKFGLEAAGTILLAGVLIAFIYYPIHYSQKTNKRSIPGTEDTKHGYEDLPVVVQISSLYLERVHYSPHSNRYFFILDWEAASSRHSGLFSPQEYKHLDAYKRNYPQIHGDKVVLSTEFLKKYNKFLVLDYMDYTKKCPLQVAGLDKVRQWEDLHCPQWVETRLLNNEAYKVTFLGE